jgi:hypothetical protein
MWGFTHWFSTADSPYGLLYRQPYGRKNLCRRQLSESH